MKLNTSAPAASWYVYLIRCSDNSLYTGISTDVERRLKEHQDAGNKSAKYLKGKGPLKLVWKRAVDNRSEATKLELTIKKLSKQHKEQLVENADSVLNKLSS